MLLEAWDSWSNTWIMEKEDPDLRLHIFQKTFYRFDEN